MSIALALAIAGLAFGAAWLMMGAGGRSPADADISGWIEPLRSQASIVESDVAAADRLLRLYILQGRTSDADKFDKKRREIDDDLAKMTTIASNADREVRDATVGFTTAVTKWLGLADEVNKAAHAETLDNTRIAVMGRMGPEDPLENMAGQHKALANALSDASDARKTQIGATDRSRTMYFSAGLALAAAAAALAFWLAARAGRAPGAPGRGVDLGLLRAVLDQLPDAIAIFGEDGRVLVSNLSAARVVESIEGSSSRLALYAGAGEPVTDDVSPLSRALGGQHVLEHDLFVERLDGSLIPVEVHAEPILDNGRATAAVVVVRDRGEDQRAAAEMEALADAKSAAEVKSAEVARRLRAVEAELAEAKAASRQLEQSAELAHHEADTRGERFERLVNGGGAIGVALWSAADEMRLVDCNEEALALLGERRRLRDVRGSTLLEIVPGAEASGMLDLFRKVAASGETYSSEEYYVQGLRHGAAYWRFTLIPLVSEPEQPAEELVLLGIDVTAPVEQRASATTTVMTSGNWTIEDVLLAISNDLRTPILSIQGMVGLFRQKYAEAVPDVTALHYLELTQRNADQIATLIDDLVELSSLGNEELKTAEIPLAAAIEEAWRANPRPGIELRVAGPLPTVRADRAKLMRAFRDMFDTATSLKRDGAGAWIHVGVRDLGQQWEIELADNGKGVTSDEEGERLFGPLAHHLVTVPNNGGPTLIAGGLGLAAVRRIAELHGGTASVTPSPEGEGVIYSLTIQK